MEIKYNVVRDWPIKGVNFVDFTPSIMDIEVFTEITNKLNRCIKKFINLEEIDYIIAPDARGFIWGSALGIKNKIGVIPIRKHGKLPDNCVSKSITYKTEYSETILDMPKVDLKGKKCVFVDDVFATGGTYYAIKDLVKSVGGELVGGVCLYDVLLTECSEVETLLTSKDLITEYM